MHEHVQRCAAHTYIHLHACTAIQFTYIHTHACIRTCSSHAGTSIQFTYIRMYARTGSHSTHIPTPTCVHRGVQHTQVIMAHVGTHIMQRGHSIGVPAFGGVLDLSLIHI